MSTSLQVFSPHPPDSAGVISWVHIGDLHMTRAGEQNDIDLQKIVAQINRSFAASISFVYLPGDVADDGSIAAYAVVRRSLDQLTAPCCAIVGDHDVHEKSHANFLSTMSAATHYSFPVGNVRFLAMNAFDRPDPGSFAVLPEQLDWLQRELEQGSAAGHTAILFLHCYPSDLKVGREDLTRLIQQHNVTLIDMGHTHYNEIANDGRTLYTATRSTGQIEEGSVGFSVTNLDDGVVSWRFLELEKLPAVIITSPSDERLLTTSLRPSTTANSSLRIRAKVWSESELVRVVGEFAGRPIELHRIAGSQVWQTSAPLEHLPPGAYPLRVTAEDAAGNTAEDEIRVRIGSTPHPRLAAKERDQDNALAAWPEHGLLGSQLGPNKNGRKW